MPTYNHALSDYISSTFAIEDDTLKRIRKGIADNGLPQISIKAEEGRFLQFLVAASGSELALEIGTLGGYSGTWIARGLPENGRLITLERDAHHAAVAREHFQIAGVSAKVDVREGNALELLASMGDEGQFDFIFIDAEKESYPKYLDWAIENLRLGGIVVAHNAFLHGAIIDDRENTERIDALRTFNNRLASDPRMISTIFPAGDGLAIGMLQS
jgi:caffeoyl-CoA O-methyltransferase